MKPLEYAHEIRPPYIYSVVILGSDNAILHLVVLLGYFLYIGSDASVCISLPRY